MTESLLEELKRYVEFGDADGAALREVGPALRPEFPAVAEVFYARILGHEGARKALEGGESTVGRLKLTLVAWMGELFAGPWDDAYFERRCRIGRVHVRIGLPQHYMFGAMNVVRGELVRRMDAVNAGEPARRVAARLALAKILDIELAIMLHTYREDLLAQQARTERLSTFGQLVGSIGHELRNPLGVIESSVFILKGQAKEDPRARKHLDRIGEQVGIANGIIGNLLGIIRDAPLVRQKVALADVAASVIELLSVPDGARVAVDGLADLPSVSGDPESLRQVFSNLVQNALQALPGGRGEVRLSGRPDGSHVVVEVTDTGPGVDESVRRRLFEPLVTTKKRGIGLGLALVKRIVERHGGTVAYAAGGGGAPHHFAVRLPVG